MTKLPTKIKSGDPHAENVVVYRDGNPVTDEYYIEVDTVAGYGIRCKRENGRFVKDGDEIATERITGKFELRWSSDQPTLS